MSSIITFFKDLSFGFRPNRKRRIDPSDESIPKLMRISDSSQRNNQFQPINNNCNISNRAFAFDEDYFNQVKKKRTNFNTILEGFCMEQQNKHIRSFKQITEDIDENSKEENAHSSGCKKKSNSQQDDDVQFVSSAFKSQPRNESINRRIPELVPISSNLLDKENYKRRIFGGPRSRLDFRNMMDSSTSSNSILGLNHREDSKKKYGSLLNSVMPDLYSFNSSKETENLSIDTSFQRSNDFSLIRGQQTRKSDLLYESKFNNHTFQKSTTFIDLSDDNDDLTIPKNLSVADISTSSSVRERTKVPTVAPINSMLERTVRKECFRDTAIEDICKRFEEIRRKKDNEILEVSQHISNLNNETLEEEKTQQKRIEDVITNLKQTVILDEEDEKIDEFKPLTSKQLDIIRFGLQGGSQHEVLIEKFNLTITRGDILTLYDSNWLNDGVINFYMELIKERSVQNEDLPRAHTMNTFFIPKLLESGYQGVRRWTRRVDIFSFDIIPVPVHVGKVHWCMAIINLRDKWIRYYDSMGRPNNSVLEALKRYLQDESLDKKQKPFDTSSFQIENVRNCPQQQNGSDCGVFSCMFAEFISRDSEISFDQSHMPYFRNKMVFEIMNGKMLL